MSLFRQIFAICSHSCVSNVCRGAAGGNTSWCLAKHFPAPGDTLHLMWYSVLTLLRVCPWIISPNVGLMPPLHSHSQSPHTSARAPRKGQRTEQILLFRNTTLHSDSHIFSFLTTSFKQAALVAELER